MSAIVWHDVECGGYTADLPLWRELAESEAGPVLDIGAGAGRVALDLARHGHDVTALDRDGELLAELAARAAAAGVEVRTEQADAAGFELRGPPFGLIVVPMQTIQLLAGRAARTACLHSARDHLAAGGLVALAVAEELEPFELALDQTLSPDTGERDGWRYRSFPVAIRAGGDGVAVLERVRELIAPDGTRSSEGDMVALCTLTARELESEGRAAGPPPSRRATSPRPTPISAPRWCCCVADGVLRVCALYPDLMNIYADRGNLLLLERRCEWRGLGFELRGAGLGDEVDPDAHDLFYLGGGQDRDQQLCAQDLATVKRDALHAAAERGRVIFAVCGGYQLLGHSYELGGDRLPGVGLVDLETVRDPGPRLIGNVAIEVDLGAGPQVLAGFENHGGRTHLGSGASPLGRVLKGHGNNGQDGREGVLGGARGSVVGTYLHGPLLPKNAWFADWLTATALGRGPGELPPLDDALEEAAHSGARRAAGL